MNLNRLGIFLAHLLPPELSNKFSLEGLKLLYSLGFFSSKNLKTPFYENNIECLGLNFPNKIDYTNLLQKFTIIHKITNNSKLCGTLPHRDKGSFVGQSP